MKSIKKLILTSLLALFFTSLFADEGMWLPLQISKMQGKITSLGGKLTPQDIYDINNSSIKDAVVQFANYCTGEVVSDKGLLFTNHHCGYDAVASLSSADNNFLDQGFWATSFEDELPVPGLSVSFLVTMEDVTERITGAEDPFAEQLAVESEAIDAYGEGHDIQVFEMYQGLQFFLVVYKVYTDIRLVGAPPSSIGKFGGDTDNWMWPRHTGDFSVFRIYAGDDNEPADFAPNNKPYKPAHFLPVSLKGVEEGTFAMTVGFPGSTERYLTSDAVDFIVKNEYPDYVNLMGKRLDIMKADMDADPSVKLALASDYASLANSYKYFKGVIERYEKTGLIKGKKTLEKRFTNWVNEDDARKEKYGSVIADLKSSYKDHKGEIKLESYLNFAVFSPGFIDIGFNAWFLQRAMKQSPDDKTAWEGQLAKITEQSEGHFSSFKAETDKKIFAAMMRALYNDLADQGITEAPFFNTKSFTKSKAKGGKDRFDNYASAVYDKSILVNKKKMDAFLKKPSLKALEKDAGVEFITKAVEYYQSLAMGMGILDEKQNQLMQLYIEGLMEMQPEKEFFPDANSSMRMSFGQVEPYSADNKDFKFYTVGSEILEKEKPGDDEFSVPEDLHNLLKSKDYGRYARKDGSLPVCFLSSNDITGGNSGSPVIDGEGNLIGIAFDGNWESMISDLYYEPEINRTISVDIRYVLFVIDKYAKAQRLIDELQIAN